MNELSKPLSKLRFHLLRVSDISIRLQREVFANFVALQNELLSFYAHSASMLVPYSNKSDVWKSF